MCNLQKLVKLPATHKHRPDRPQSSNLPSDLQISTDTCTSAYQKICLVCCTLHIQGGLQVYKMWFVQHLCKADLHNCFQNVITYIISKGLLRFGHLLLQETFFYPVISIKHSVATYTCTIHTGSQVIIIAYIHGMHGLGNFTTRQ